MLCRLLPLEVVSSRKTLTLFRVFTSNDLFKNTSFIRATRTPSAFFYKGGHLWMNCDRTSWSTCTSKRKTYVNYAHK